MLAARVGVSLSELWGGQVGDVFIYAQARKEEREWQQELAAWHAANLMNMWKGKRGGRITPARLLGKQQASEASGREELARRVMLQREKERQEAEAEERVRLLRCLTLGH